MRRFGPFTAEGGLVLALAVVIAGGTFAVDSFAPDTKPQTRTVYGSPTVRVHDVGAGGIQPGAVQPRAVIPIQAAAVSTLPGAPVVTAPTTATPAPKKKKGKVKATPTPTVPVDEVIEEPGTDPTDPVQPGGGGTCALLVLCPPGGSSGSEEPSEQDPQTEVEAEPTQTPKPAKTTKPKAAAKPAKTAKPEAPPAE